MERRSGTSGLDQLAAGVLCVGFEGATPQEAPLERLAQLAPGGIIVFDRNAQSVAQTRALLGAIRAAIASGTGEEPFAAVDQEGGRVSRLRRGAHEIPPMMALGATADAHLAERVGALIGADVRDADIDVDFAPVIDLALSANNSVIGDRALGDDPELVGKLGAALARGIQSQGVAATLKHFPGHGATAVDSHLQMPRVADGAKTFASRDLIPFVRGIASGARAVMSAHVAYEALDAEHPATLSHSILTHLLREELGFGGVCFTDCLEMDAIAATIGPERGAVAALAAGADCVVVSHRLDVAERARAAIVDAVKSGALPRARLEQARERVATLRNQRACEWPPVDAAAGAQTALRAITVVRAERSRGITVAEPVTVVSFEGSAADGVRGAHVGAPSLSLALRERHVRSESMRVALEPTPEMIEQLVAVVAAQAGRDFVFLARRAHLHVAQRDALQALLAVAPDAVLVSLREPFDAVLFPEARALLCTYGDGEVSISGLAEVLSGRARADGQLPVRLAAAARQ